MPEITKAPTQANKIDQYESIILIMRAEYTQQMHNYDTQINNTTALIRATAIKEWLDKFEKISK